METADTPRARAAQEVMGAMDPVLFKSLSEPVRVDILKHLLENGRSDVTAIAERMPQDRSVVSRHLSLMKQAGLLRGIKDGRHMFYEIDAGAFLEKFDSIASTIRRCMKQCCPE